MFYDELFYYFNNSLLTYRSLSRPEYLKSLIKCLYGNWGRKRLTREKTSKMAEDSVMRGILDKMNELKSKSNEHDSM